MDPESDKREIDVIIPTYNNKEELLKCLDSLETQTFRSFYVYICVDGSTDDTLKWLTSHSFSFPFEILEHDDKMNHGRAAARNLGLNNVKAPLVLLLDSDVIANPDLMASHVSFINKWGDISVGDIQYINAPDNLWARYLQTRGKHRFADEALLPPSYFVTQNVAFSVDLVKKTGLMDENIQGYGGDDLEYGVRLVELTGKKCRYNKKALVRSVMNKDLTVALNQMYEFGTLALPYLNKKFEKYSRPPEIFKYNLIHNRWIYSSLWYALSKIVLHFPFFIAKHGVHYLVFYNVATGYKNHG